MNTGTYDQETSDALARWWWPGQWLRIVWSVWVDQKWYWENVYPRLEKRRRGWGIFVQAWLGSMLIASFLLVISVTITGGLSIEEFPIWLIALLTLGFFVMNLLGGAEIGVPWSVVFIPTIIPTIAVYTFCYVFAVDIQGSWLVYCALCLVWGLAYGVFRGLSGGSVGDIVIGLLVVSSTVASITVAGIPNRLLLLLSRTVVAFILGGALTYAGARWARRDLPEEIAERLKARKDR